MAYAIFEFKNRNSNNRNGMKLLWNGQSSKAPSVKTVSLQAYNRTAVAWQTKVLNDSANADTDFNLTHIIVPADLSDYEDGSGWVACRIVQ